MSDLRHICTDLLPETLTLLKALSAIESPSDNPAAVDACAAVVADRFRALGAAVQSLPAAGGRTHLSADWAGEPAGHRAADERPFLAVCHLDTVWPIGTLAHMPLREAEGKLFGPGVYDMKSGVAILWAALRALQIAGQAPRRPVRMLFTADEELGSPTSRALIEAEAPRAALVLVLEPAMAGGQLKTFRKGVGEFQIIAHGRSAHAGVDHQKGINAIEELAHHIVRLQQLTDYSQGTTVNVGTITGGSAGNVVPDRAEMTVDFRVSRMSEIDRIVPAIAGLQPVVPGARLEITGGLNRPPMERTATMAATFERVRQIGQGIGLQLEEGATGGASDGNFTAALGIPTLDGLGARGDGAHAVHEHIVIDSLAERAALLAAIFTEWD